MLSPGYRLLDFGNARKLEQFGSVILDRPCPAAEGFVPSAPGMWLDAAIVQPDAGNSDAQFPESWRVAFPLDEDDSSVSLDFQLKVTPFGHVGVFPEQLPRWRWLYRIASRQRLSDKSNLPHNLRKLRALNLFAYTGGSSLALARGGAEVVHVDASAPSIAWARNNAQLCKLAEHPIRWIVEDAYKFVQREIRRGNRYHIIVLDPPAYGHGPNGKAWDLAAQWQDLVNGCLQLMERSQQAYFLWTGHSGSPDPKDLVESLLRHGRWQIDSGRSVLRDLAGRALDAGYFVQAASPPDDM